MHHMAKLVLKTLRVENETHRELVDIGGYNETMNDIIKKCIKAYKEKYKK